MTLQDSGQPSRLDPTEGEPPTDDLSAFDLSPQGRALIALAMFCGRLGVLTVVVALTRVRPSMVQYPEEKILMG